MEFYSLRNYCFYLLFLGTSWACDDAREYNCGRFDSPDWTAPEGCVCINPEGKPTTLNDKGEEIEIVCEEKRLQACPSTSGFGCALFGQKQIPIEAGNPALVEIHVDIGGHLHDLCCAQHYGRRSGQEYLGRCNGCIGAGRNPVGCVAQNLLPLIYNSPESDVHACFLEWRYATGTPFEGDAYWPAVFDTSMRWNSLEVVRRGMGGARGPYATPSDAPDLRTQRPLNPNGEPYRTEAPLYGLALSPAQNLLGIEQRAPDGQRLGSEKLSLPPEEYGLGLSEKQIASFCQSTKAALTYDGWRCVSENALMRVGSFDGGGL